MKGKELILKGLGVVMVFCFGMWFNGCAAIVYGSHRTIQTDSDPPGARVTVDEVIGSTPQAIQVPARSSYTVSISKPGFERVSQKLNSEIIIWPIIADILLGFWPLIIDAATGDWYTPAPNTIFTRLNPEKTGPGSQTK